MKQTALTGLLFLLSFISFARAEEENGKIYIKHPNPITLAEAIKDWTSDHKKIIYGDFSKLVKNP